MNKANELKHHMIASEHSNTFSTFIPENGNKTENIKFANYLYVLKLC